MVMMTTFFFVFFTEENELACFPYLSRTIAVDSSVKYKYYLTVDCIERDYAIITWYPNMFIFYIANILSLSVISASS